MIMDRNFNCAYAVSKMKTKIMLNTPELKRHGVSAFHIMDDIFGNNKQFLFFFEIKWKFILFPVPALMSFEVATNSPLEARFTSLVRILIESGYMQRCEAKALELIRTMAMTNLSQADAMEAPDDTTFSSFSSDKILPYFVVFNIGLFVAFLIFIAEIMYDRYVRNKLSCSGHSHVETNFMHNI